MSMKDDTEVYELFPRESSPEFALDQVLHHLTANPELRSAGGLTALFNDLMVNPYALHHPHFMVAAAPGTRLPKPLQPGDILIRRALGEGGPPHVAVFVSGELIPDRLIAHRGWSTESRRRGYYAQVIDTGTAAQQRQSQPLRYITDESGYLPYNQMILRLKLPPPTSTSWPPYETRHRELISLTESVTTSVQIHLRFQVWNLKTPAFDSLPDNIEVDLIDDGPVLGKQILATEKTDATGYVFFNLPNLQTRKQPNLYFLVRPNNIFASGHTLPKQWSTKGWQGRQGTTSKDGYYPNFASGVPLGSATDPLVFGVGLDFHIRLAYADQSKSPVVDNPAPPGVPITIVVDRQEKSRQPTDNQGEVHDVLFDIDPESTISFLVEFELQGDTTINLKPASVAMKPWYTKTKDADQRVYSNQNRTSLGSQSSPKILRCSVENRNTALYVLKTLREFSIFLYHITGHTWPGFLTPLSFNLGLADLKGLISRPAYSWPVGRVNLPDTQHITNSWSGTAWHRATTAHELAHQVMWQEINFDSAKIREEALKKGHLLLYHDYNMVANSEHALLDGWAEFFEAIFDTTGSPPYPLFANDLVDSKGAPFSVTLPHNWGELTESAFANGLWAIFEKYVVTPAITTNAHIPESNDGNVLSTTMLGTTSWLQDSNIQTRFLDMIWLPLQELRNAAHPGTTDMLSAIASHNQARWHEFLPEFQTWSMAMTTPAITNINPGGGLVAGGNTITITGEHFALGTTTVTIGTAAATSITVTDSRNLTAVVPSGTVGAADVIVTVTATIPATPATATAAATTATIVRSTTRKGGYTYTL